MVWYPPRNLLGKLLGKPQREAKYDVIFVRIVGFGAGGKRNPSAPTTVLENLIFKWVLTMEASVLLGY